MSKLARAILKQAIDDLILYKSFHGKTYAGKQNTRWGRDAERFIFKDDHLEKFIFYHGLNVDAETIRKRVDAGITKRVWNFARHKHDNKK
jgi:hypothetical protein